MVKITSSSSFVDQPCERCGSKKKISKTWKEAFEMYSGSTMVEISQIVCVNKVCQRSFDENRAEEIVKKNELKLKKEVQDKLRKENMLRNIANSRKSKSVSK
jgi:hypothetical protein